MTSRKQLHAVFIALLLLVATATPAMGAVGAAGDARPANLDSPNIVSEDDKPTFVINYNGADGLRDLREWVNSDSDRSIVSVDADASTATVAAPRSDVYRDADVFGHDLIPDPAITDESWTSSVSVNFQVSNVEPITDLKERGANAQLRKRAEHVPATKWNGLWKDVPTQGMAFAGNSSPTTMAEVRNYTNATSEDLPASVNGSGTTVAVIDTGLNTANGTVFGAETEGSDLRVHPASKSFLTNTTVREGGINAVVDRNGHGTWVASSIAANTSNDTHDGMAPQAEILALKALGQYGSGSVSDIANAIRYAADHDADVISMSLGTTEFSPAMYEAVQYAYDHGVSAVVVAAGNSRAMQSPGIQSPARYPQTIAVGATNGSVPATAGSAYFSQFGPQPKPEDEPPTPATGTRVDVAAPGMTVTAATPTVSGNATYLWTLSGTSMATPIVSGAVALALDANPAWIGEEKRVRKWVNASARPVPGATRAAVGNGMLDTQNLVTSTRSPGTQKAAMTDIAKERAHIYYEARTDEGLLDFSVNYNISSGSFEGDI